MSITDKGERGWGLRVLHPHCEVPIWQYPGVSTDPVRERPFVRDLAVVVDHIHLDHQMRSYWQCIAAHSLAGQRGDERIAFESEVLVETRGADSSPANDVLVHCAAKVVLC